MVGWRAEPKLFDARLLRLFGVRGSWMMLKVSGTVKKCDVRIIRAETPALNCCTCRRMYRRKASLLQRPINMMVYTGTSFRYMAMADPLLREWVPISSEEKPSLSFPSAAAEALSFIRTASERM